MDNFEVGQLVIGKVSAVRPYAVFLNFSDGRSGLLHISEISDSYIRDIEKFASIGDEMKVQVIDVDKNNGFLRVSLKRVKQEDFYSTHTNENKKSVQTSEDEFKTLKEKLPQWIEEALKKTEEDKND